MARPSVLNLSGEGRSRRLVGAPEDIVKRTSKGARGHQARGVTLVT
jgi:hypothetical protein